MATVVSGGRVERILDTTALQLTTARFAEAVLPQYVVTFAQPASTRAEELRVGVKRDGVRVIAPAWTAGVRP